MKQTKLLKPTHLLTAIVVLILALVPLDALMTVWAAGNFGHYTAFRLWDEALLLIAGFLSLRLLWRHRELWHKLKRLHIIWLILAYVTLQLLTGLIAFANHNVDAKALGYGLIIDLRFLLFFVVCLAIGWHSDWLKRHWRQVLLAPAIIVVAFGLLQHFALPYDFLKHFGYGAQTIFPYETINHNLHYVRIMSTLRGANPLGAYLIIIICAVVALLLKAKDKNWRIAYGFLTLGTAINLFFSYSRSAWIGAALGIMLILVIAIKNQKLKRGIIISLVGLVAIIALVGIALRNNPRFENIFAHTQTNSAIKTTSDQGHAAALKSGLKDVLHEPLGHGPGTAGPASIYNNHPARIAENYFVQIAQEVGWLGLAIFLLINWLVVKSLWRNRADQLSLILLASFIGITFVNLLSHAWADDTLSYIWWGLAGIALAPTLIKVKSHEAKK